MQPLRPGPFRGDLVGQISPQTDASTGEITRSPLYVTAPWKRWATPDIFPNIAALVVLSSPISHPAPEPVFYKRPALQLDQFPNLALRVQPYTPRSYLDPVCRRSLLSIEHFPNLAVRGDEAAQMMLPGMDGQTFVRSAPQVDIAPNLAVRVAAPVYVPPAPLDIASARKWPIPDLAPNIAVRVSPYVPRALLDIQPSRRSIQPDLSPNIAVQFSVPFLPPALDVPSFHRTAPQIDLFPNLAVGFVGFVASSSPDPVIRRSLTRVDLYPNLAVTAPVAQIPLLVAVEPWINKRFAPQVEVFQNRAIYAPAEEIVAPNALNEPVRWHDPVQVDLYPNIAVGFSNDVIAPVVIVAPSGGFLHEFQRAHAARHRRKRELEALADPIEREIAILLHEPDDQAELKRLRSLVADFTHELPDPERVQKALNRAIYQETAVALRNLEHEIQRAIEDEDAALLLILN
jgi:hypothetical protein